MHISFKKIAAVISISIALTAVAFFGKTFAKPLNISKKIFAYELVQKLKLAFVQKTKCYKDVTKKDEISYSICSLKKAKKLPQTTNNKFYPNSKLKWGFTIETLCRSQNWTEKKTFKACTSYARQHGFLDAPLPKKISSKKLVAADELNLLFERIFGKEVALLTNTPLAPKPETATPTDIPPEKIPQTTFTPFPETTIDAKFYNNIILKNPLPNTFYWNEVYFAEGDLNGIENDEVLVFLCREGKSCDDSINFIGKTENKHFKIPVYFNETGNFNIGIIPGRSGQSLVGNISVILGPPSEPASGTKPTELSAAYESGKTTFNWNGEGTLNRLTVFQDKERKDYIFRQSVKSFSPPSKDFEKFKKGDAFWFVKQNAIQSDIKLIKLTTQDFRKVENADIKIKTMAETFKTPAHFVFEAQALSAIQKKAALTLPNGQVKEFSFSDHDIQIDENFKIETDFDSMGTYIFEVNDPFGGAIVNVPIYIGEEIPLLPDYFALNETKLNTNPVDNLDEARNKLLNLINADRAQYSLPAVTLSNELNEIAQNHSKNMVKLNFFGHIDPFGVGPDDRRKAAKYPAPIKENLAKAGSIELSQAGLMRSPIHRIVIIDPAVTQVGLGIAKNPEGYFIITQNFSGKLLSLNDLASIESDLLNAANKKRAANAVPALVNNQILHNVASQWSQKMVNEKFFDTISPSGLSLIKLIRDNGIMGTIQANIIETNDQNQLENELLQQAGILDSGNTNIGLGLIINDIGEIFITVIYTS